MTHERIQFLLLLAIALAGCPSTPPVDGEQAGPPPDPAAAAVSVLGDAAAPPPPPTEGGAGNPPDLGSVAFGRFLTPGAPSVTIHVVAEGIETGQIDFTAFEGDQPGAGQAEVVHAQRFEGGSLDVTAPADFPRKLFVTATSVDQDGRPVTPGVTASLRETLVIGSEDQSITLTVDTPDLSRPVPSATGPAAASGVPPAPTGAPPAPTDDAPTGGAPAAP
ncbi:MAG: hypothetical protein ABIO70_19215 [Pseudomonadota bacterium]